MTTNPKQFPAQPIRLYGHALSGHTHRVALFMSLLGLPFERIDVDLAKGAQRAPEFLRRNAFGQVPVIEDGEVTQADSNAILVYLNARYAPDATRWLPADPIGAARVQRWLSAAAGPLAGGPALARVIQVFKVPTDPADAIARAHHFLRVMETELAGVDWLAAPHATLADIAHYSYVAHAPEGGVSLATYPSVRAWLARIEALPGFVPMQRTPVAMAA